VSTRVEHVLTGLRDTPLGSYLGAIGLAKVVAAEADPGATLRWVGNVPHLRTTVADLAEWLQSAYRPTVVLSPWNGGSGYGLKDKHQREALEELLALDETRVGAWRVAHAVVDPLAARARAEGWDKERLVRELRNRVPEQLLGWLDSAVILTRDDLAFPPLLGTGGNDGRLDFSSNFHQRLLDVLPERHHAESVRWAGALLDGGSTPLVKAAAGQFDPVSAGGRNSSSFGAADWLTNPWGFVLMVEGASALTPGVVQRLHGRGRAAMPFTVVSTPYGGGSGTSPEESRGEFWAPRWSAAMTWPEIAQLFREGRAAWNGRTAARAVHMYEAARSFGMARGVEGFTRFGFQRRNGLAFVAVKLDRVQVYEDPLVHALLPVEWWIESSRAAESKVSTAPQWRRAERAHLLYAQSGGTGRLVDLLVESTRLHVAVGQSAALRETVRPPVGAPLANTLHGVLEELLVGHPEARVARALVMATLQPDGARLNLAHLVLPDSHGRAWGEIAVTGLGRRPLPQVLADVAVWCARRPPREPHHEHTDVTGIRLVTGRGRAPWQDLHAWVSGSLDEDLLERFVLAFLALDWYAAPPLPGQVVPLPAVPDPALALLSPFSEGLASDRATAPLLGLDPTWALRLRAGKEHAVVREAVGRLARGGWQASEPVDLDAPGRGLRLAGALLVPTKSMTALRMVATPPPKPETTLITRPEESTHEPENLS
jgi:CRISPR-associated protein Csx17